MFIEISAPRIVSIIFAQIDYTVLANYYHQMKNRMPLTVKLQLQYQPVMYCPTSEAGVGVISCMPCLMWTIRSYRVPFNHYGW